MTYDYIQDLSLDELKQEAYSLNELILKIEKLIKQKDKQLYKKVKELIKEV
jgi:hypothetical protein